jgi:sec-independent protein translocase protein TatA
MGELLTPIHLMVVAIVAFVLFGGKKLPELGKGLGEGLRGFKDGIKGLTDELTSAKVAPAVPAKTENNCVPVAHSGDPTTSAVTRF